jgi:NAD-dependent dihydropyrimidine dehydrogenase PreA subunit
MILDRKFYNDLPIFQRLWGRYQMKKLRGEKLFRFFDLLKSSAPDRLYFYSPRLKRKPRFTGNVQLLQSWQDAKLCERMCPTQAIQVTENDFLIDDRGCITCGLCVELAPPGLLEVTHEYGRPQRS